MTILACDFGGTRIKAGLVESGRVRASAILPTIASEPMATTLLRVGDELETLCHGQGLSPGSTAGVAMALPALVDSRCNRVLNHYGKYRDAPKFDFTAWTRGRWNLPVALENDARLALIGEWQHGAGRGARRLAIVTLGTGIGTAVLLDGQPLRGPNFVAGNLGGHLIVNPNGLPCPCGQRGCVETEAGEATLAARAAALRTARRRVAEQPASLNYQQVFALAAGGTDWAKKLADAAIRDWAVLCINLTTAYDLDRLIIGGGIIHAPGLLDALRIRLRALAAKPARRLQLVAAEQPENMALLGAEWLLREAADQESQGSASSAYTGK